MNAQRIQTAHSLIRDIKRGTRRKFSAEEKIRIILQGLRGEDSIAGLCRREGIAQSIYYKWSRSEEILKQRNEIKKLIMKSRRSNYINVQLKIT